MNIRQGLFRLWIFCSVLWVGFMAYQGEEDYSNWDMSPGNYQYAQEFKEWPPKKTSSNDYYDTFSVPSHSKHPASFAPILKEYQKSWDDRVAEGKEEIFEMEDFSQLYLDSRIRQEDKDFLKKEFMAQKFSRKLDKIKPWVKWALGPPLAALALGVALSWVLRGFVS